MEAVTVATTPSTATSITFILDGRSFIIPEYCIEKNTLLHSFIHTSLKTNKQGSEIIIDGKKLGVTADQLQIVYDLIVDGKPAKEEDAEILSFWLCRDLGEYEIATIAEDWMRAKMYQKNFEKHPMNTDPFYNLIKIDQGKWKELEVQERENEDLLFTSFEAITQPWKEVEASLAILRDLCAIPGVFIAGGRIFSALFGTPSSDVDIFLYNTSPEEALEKIRKIKTLFEAYAQQLERRKDINPTIKIMRTGNALTFRCGPNATVAKEWQVVLRLYRSPSEILHGFDVDCCCMGYDGKNIWMTQRCYYSILRGYNTVNFNRLSPSYEFRLAKYGTRGMAVKIPNFEKKSVNKAAIKEYFESGKVDKGSSTAQRYKHISILKGLDILLFLNEKATRSKLPESTKGVISRLCKERSDYCPVPYINFRQQGAIMINVLEYLASSRDIYPDFAAKYMPYIKQVLDGDEEAREEDIEYIDIKDKYDDWSWIHLTYPFENKSIDFVDARLHGAYFDSEEELRKEKEKFDRKFEALLAIPEPIYKVIEAVRPWTLPATISFKTTNPGEQMTNTFHQTVLEDNQVWFKGFFYGEGDSKRMKEVLSSLPIWKTSEEWRLEYLATLSPEEREKEEKHLALIREYGRRSGEIWKIEDEEEREKTIREVDKWYREQRDKIGRKVSSPFPRPLSPAPTVGNKEQSTPFQGNKEEKWRKVQKELDETEIEFFLPLSLVERKEGLSSFMEARERRYRELLEEEEEEGKEEEDEE